VQARYLKANGCLTMQGYLYHRPIPLSQFIGLLGEQGGDEGAGRAQGPHLVVMQS
jgi:EAL domain-containing protein (putative c-di-GMP-specific phosphodiesterase class I)